MFQSDTAPRHDSVPDFHVAKLRSVDTTAIGDLPYLPYWIRMPIGQKRLFAIVEATWLSRNETYMRQDRINSPKIHQLSMIDLFKVTSPVRAK